MNTSVVKEVSEIARPIIIDNSHKFVEKPSCFVTHVNLSRSKPPQIFLDTEFYFGVGCWTFIAKLREISLSENSVYLNYSVIFAS